MTGDEPNWGGPADDASVDRFAEALRDDATWAEPPADLLDRILVAGRTGQGGHSADPVDLAEPVGDAGQAEAAPVVPIRRRSWPRTLAAVAAASVVVFGAGFLVGIAGDDDPPAAADDDELVAQLALVGTELAPAASAAVDVFDRGAGYALILQTSGLEPAPDGGYYEGWLSSADDVVSVGTFHMRGGDGTVVLWSGVAIAEFPVLTVRRHAVDSTGDDPVMMTGTFAPGV